MSVRGNAPTLLWSQLWSFRYWIGVVTLLSGVATALAFTWHPVEYSSTVVMFLDEAGIDEEENPMLPGHGRSGSMRLKQFATSSAIVDKLINACDLYAHYGVDTTAPYYHELATSYLVGNIEARILDANSISITVQDLDRVKASVLANQLFVELRASLSDRTETRYARQVLLHRELVRYEEEQASKRKAELLELAGHFRNDDPALAGRTNAPINMSMRLMEASAKFAEANSRLQSTGQRMELIAMMNKQGLLGELTLVNRAMIDTTTQPRLTIMLWILCSMLLAMLLSTGMLVLWFKEGPAVMAWFKQPVAG